MIHCNKTFIISQFLWVRNLTQLGWNLRIRVTGEAAFQGVSRALVISRPNLGRVCFQVYSDVCGREFISLWAVGLRASVLCWLSVGGLCQFLAIWVASWGRSQQLASIRASNCERKRLSKTRVPMFSNLILKCSCPLLLKTALLKDIYLP